MNLARNAKPSGARLGRIEYVAIVAVLGGIALSPAPGGGMLQNTYPHLPPELNRIPDQNQADEINSQHQQNQSFDAANAERKKQIATDCAKLLKLATAMKTEVDKTSKDTLSLEVIHKADEIEKLAHDVKDKMKLSVGPG
jgi:hypothetical protein